MTLMITEFNHEKLGHEVEDLKNESVQKVSAEQKLEQRVRELTAIFPA